VNWERGECAVQTIRAILMARRTRGSSCFTRRRGSRRSRTGRCVRFRAGGGAGDVLAFGDVGRGGGGEGTETLVAIILEGHRA